MNLEPFDPVDAEVGMRIVVSSPFDARLWVKAPDAGFRLSPMRGFGERDSHYLAEVQRLDLPYAWLDVDVDVDVEEDQEETVTVRVYVDTRTLRLWFDEEDKP